jgi:hypothetical protein
MTNDPYAIPEPGEPESSKLDALRYLQMIYRDPQLSTAVRMRAAGLAIPYEMPKLAVTAVVTDQDVATILDQRIKRFEEMRLLEANDAKIIEAQPISGNPREVETKPPLARTPDRRFRRF